MSSDTSQRARTRPPGTPAADTAPALCVGRPHNDDYEVPVNPKGLAMHGTCRYPTYALASLVAFFLWWWPQWFVSNVAKWTNCYVKYKLGGKVHGYDWRWGHEVGAWCPSASCGRALTALCSCCCLCLCLCLQNDPKQDKRFPHGCNTLDIYRLLTCWVAISAMGLETLDMYWGGKRFGAIALPDLGLVMKQYKFKMLWAAIRFYDCRRRRSFGGRSYNKLHKVLPLVMHVQKQLTMSWLPGLNNSLDELGFPSRHRWLRHFNKTKPHKFHIELFGMADAKSNRLFGIQVCEGANRFVDERGRSVKAHEYRSPNFSTTDWQRVERNNWGLMEMKVYKLLQLLPKGACVSMDSRFSSLPLMMMAELELEVGIFSTMVQNRKYLPLEMMKLEKIQTTDRGFYQGGVLQLHDSEEMTIFVTVTQDSGAFISAATRGGVGPAVVWRGSMGAQSGLVSAPIIAALYNETMGGIDGFMQAA